MSLAISCCKPQNRSSISLTTLILLVSDSFVQFYRFFHKEGGMGNYPLLLNPNRPTRRYNTE